jgi:hypothetical protein
MNLSDRDRRALFILLGALVVVAMVQWWPSGEDAVTAAPTNTVEQAEMRLQRARRIAAATRERTAEKQAAEKELQTLEQGMLRAESAALAHAALAQKLRALGRRQSPAVEFRTVENGPIELWEGSWARMQLAVSLDCTVDQLVNLLADVSSQPELISVAEMHVSAASDRAKRMPVRITFAALLPRAMAPLKKGAKP